MAGRYANQVRSLMYLFDMLMHDHVKAEDAHENRNLKVYAVVRSYFWERERELKKNGKILIATIVLVRMDMNVKEHKRLSNITLRHKLK